MGTEEDASSEAAQLPETAETPTRINVAEWIMIAFTAITAIATWAGIYISSGQWDVSSDQMNIAREQMRDARENSEQATKDTRAALELSRRAAGAAETQARITQRALSIATKAADAAAEQAQASQQSAQVGEAQLRTAVQALQDQQTPHVRLWIEGELSGFKEGITLEAVTHIKNAGRITIFNGQVSVVIGYSWKTELRMMWNNLEPRGSVVMGPEDEERYLLHWDRLSPREVSRIKEGVAVIFVGMKMTFTDAAKRRHNRYVCQYWFYNHGNMIPDACPTPTQS